MTPTLYADDLPTTHEGWLLPETLLARVLPRRCNDDQLGACDDGWYDPPVTSTRMMCGFCDGRGWLYPDPPDWWQVWELGDWPDYCLRLWRVLGIVEYDDE